MQTDDCLIELFVIHSNTWNYLTLLGWLKSAVFVDVGLECGSAYGVTSTWKLDAGYVSSTTFGGARGVMVIVVGNGHGDTSSNPGRD